MYISEIDDELGQKIAEMYFSGKKMTEVARTLKVDHAAAFRWLYKNQSGKSYKTPKLTGGTKYEKALPPEKHESAKQFLVLLARLKKMIPDGVSPEINLELLRDAYVEQERNYYHHKEMFS